MEGMIRCSANFFPLTPITFLERSSTVFGDSTSVIYGDIRHSWRQTRDRCVQLAAALANRLGITYGDVVAVIAPNVPAMYELHFGVPMAGAVLCTLNIRYDAATISSLLAHSEAKVLFLDYQFIAVAKEALEILYKQQSRLPYVILIKDNTSTTSSPYVEYESFLKGGSADFQIRWPKDECDPISLNYTSGTTSSPKGVIFSHRGSYLNSLANIFLNEMPSLPVYLWCVPMFHCNGWCMAWSIAAQGGTNVCLRKVTAEDIFDSIAYHKVNYMGGAPTVLNMIVNAPASSQKPLSGKVTVATGGAPPPPQILFKMKELGFDVIHSYGLTETYGPATVCTWKPEWNSLPQDLQAKIKARQGVQHICLAEVDVKNPSTMESVPSDGKTVGEVMMRGNTVMSGYFKNAEATQEAFKGGYFRSGDLAVKHPDGYIELRDRSKDIIISGGENVSTIQVEGVLYSHPEVVEAAVVAQPDEFWGEVPCAFVKVRDGSGVSGEDLVKFCRRRLPRFMIPKTVVFDELPKTSTGKVQKFALRERAKALRSNL